MHPELRRRLILATIGKAHFSRKNGRWTNRCVYCGMSAGPWWRVTDAQLSALLHDAKHHSEWRFR